MLRPKLRERWKLVTGTTSGLTRVLPSKDVYKRQQQVLAAVKQADYIFMSTPLYWWNISAQLKAVFDRFYSLNKKNDLQGKTIHLVITGASEEDDIGYELVNKTFMEICDYIGCEFKILIVSGDDSNPAQKNEKAIAQAKAIGESL